MNELKHIADFQTVLENYQPSAEAKKVLAEVKLVLLLAPTAGGRNTIINKLVETGQYHFIVSDTTRERRMNNGVMERSGREYWFKTEEEMLDALKQGRMLEAEILFHQQVSGISVRELEKASTLHKIAINEVDINGIENVLKAKPDTVVALIVPPDFETWLQRVESRGPMDSAERNRRFETAAQIYKLAADGRYPIIINDQLDKAVGKVNALARLSETQQDQRQGREIAQKLYEATQKYLKQNA